MGVPLSEILHVCAGGLRGDMGRVLVDVRHETRPTVVADGTALPFRAGEFAAVMLDPPYTEEYARDLYGTKYPRPSHLLKEAARVVRPGGPIGFLHFLVPFPPKGCAVRRVHGVTTGCGYRIRAFTIFEREAQEALPL
jgi:SAM-dependent methyltransferase